MPCKCENVVAACVVGVSELKVVRVGGRLVDP